MCGRFQFAPKGKAILVDEFGLPEEPDFPDRINLAPTQDAPVVLSGEQGLHFLPMRWGLVPQWSKGGLPAVSFINARVESASSKASFHHAWKHRRCLILTTGYYEWSIKGGAPSLIQADSRDVFCFAGLWEPNLEDPINGKPSCTILTSNAASEIEDIHHRMPVMLNPQQYEEWLFSGVPGFGLDLEPKLAFPLTYQFVSKRLNKVAHDDPACLLPDVPIPPAPGLFDE
ncbi:MAG: hypothetical protein COA70_12455 [Planctomycetota bacterium]|nr:MAG: hypothetical protein COA70_12455 [Planctomycetota bacterium]